MAAITRVAKALQSATTNVDVSAATAPSSGQVLTATGASTATWQTAGGGGESISFIPGISARGGNNNPNSYTFGVGASNGFLAVGKFADSVLCSACFQTKVPAGKTGISAVTLIVSGDGIGGNAYLYFYSSRTDNDAAGAYQTDLTDTATAYAITASGNTTFITVPAGSYNALTMDADDIITFEVNRDAASASDTHNTSLEIVGLQITWS